VKVLQIFLVSDIGGAERVFLNLIKYREALELQYEAVIISNEVDGPLKKELLEMGVSVHQISRGQMRNLTNVRNVCKELRHLVFRIKADILFANSAQGYLYARGARASVPAFLYYMAVPQASFWKNNILDILMLKLGPSKIFVPSELIASRLSRFGVQNVKLVRHGAAIPYATEANQKCVEEALSKLKIPSSCPIILFPGRLQPWKGQEVLLDALPIVLEKIPEARAVFVGGTLFGHSKDYPESLQKKIEQLSLQDRAFFVGHQPVAAWLNRAAVVVHASIEADPFPNVCIEALAAGRPLVTNHLSGVAEILRDALDAVIVAAQNAQELGVAIIKILTNLPFADSLAKSGHEAYLKNCQVKQMVASIEEIFHSAFLRPAGDLNA
jgi:glycosyltransferase involved in cell wall biosynthesis